MEIKIKLKDYNQTIQTLSELGASHTLRLIQQDRYYNTPPQLDDFQVTDEALRIRSTQEFHPISKKILTTTHDITYKGPKLDKTVKTRIEHVCRLDNLDSMFEMDWNTDWWYSKVVEDWLTHMQDWADTNGGVGMLVLHKPRKPIGHSVVLIDIGQWLNLTEAMGLL